jgi:hypothetical protein
LNLKDEAEAHSKRIAEEKRLQEIADNIKRLHKRRLDYDHRKTYKRQHSYKGRIKQPIIYPDEEDDFNE